MGSGITFSGFNNIDFGSILNAIMQQERAPLAAMEAKRTSLQAQNSAFATFATRLGSLESAVSALAGGNTLTSVAATSSDDTAVGISTGSSSVTGRYEIVVSQLARAQVSASDTSYASVDDVIATAGVLTLAQFSQPPVQITVTSSMTLEDVANAINASPDSPVSASVVQVAPGQYRLVLTGRSTGSANGFTVDTSGLTGGAGLAFIDTDNNGISGDSPEDMVQEATDASLTVNQLPVTSASNILQDVIPGVTMTLRKQDAAKTVVVDVSQDQSATIDQVKEFAEAYNGLLTFLDEQATAVAGGKDGISRDPLVRGLREALRSTMMGEEADGALSRLAQVGIGFDRTGRIEIDEDLLTDALETSTASVQQLFGGADGLGGRFGALEDLISGYTQAGGLVANARERIDTQVARMNLRLFDLEEQLAIRRAALQQEFIAADQAMSQLNAQAGSLASLLNVYSLF